MAKLTAAKRSKLPAKDFALGKGHYPIEDKGHARAALSRISHNGTPAEKKKVREKVHRKFPGITIKGRGASNSKPKRGKKKSKTAYKR